MRLLLDTQVVIWWLEGSKKLGAAGQRALEESHSIVWLSTVTAWEMVVKMALGRLKSDPQFRRYDVAVLDASL